MLGRKRVKKRGQSDSNRFCLQTIRIPDEKVIDKDIKINQYL